MVFTKIKRFKFVQVTSVNSSDFIFLVEKNEIVSRTERSQKKQKKSIRKLKVPIRKVVCCIS